MATANLAERNKRCDDFSDDFDLAVLTILDGVTPLAQFNLVGFADSDNGSVVANPVGQVVNVGTGTANAATLTVGLLSYDLVIGVDVIINDLDYITGDISDFISLTVTSA